MINKFESEIDIRRLAEARLALLREWAKDKSCEKPDRYGRDCGRCLRCRSIYRAGALMEPLP